MYYDIVFRDVIISTGILVHSVYEAYSKSKSGLIIKRLFVAKMGHQKEKGGFPC